MPPSVTRQTSRPLSNGAPATRASLTPTGADPWGAANGVRILVYGQSGSGKCLGLGTPVLMYDGSIKAVEDVEAGDQLMGPDSQPRNVLTTARGVGPLYAIVPTKGETWVCNDAHILTLIGNKNEGGDVLRDISVKDYLQEVWDGAPGWRTWRLVRSTGVSFPSADSELPLPPYLVGLWLGDGAVGTARITNSRPEIREYIRKTASELGMFSQEMPDKNTFRVSIVSKLGTGGARPAGNPALEFFRNRCQAGRVKTIPQEYLTASREDRRQLLAGILDTDGDDTGVGNTSVTVTGEPYRDGLLYLCRSLGLAAYCRVSRTHTCTSGKVSTYFRVTISGDLESLPTLVKKFGARKQCKRSHVIGFEMEELGEGDYYGFEIDGDGRFLLGDFTITHNTTLASTFPGPTLWLICSGGNKPGELRSIDTPENRRKITPAVIDSTSVLKGLVAGAAEYQTVVLDHASGLADLILKEILGLDELPAQKGWGLASQQQYGQLALQCKEHFRSLLNLPGNVVILAQERVFGGKDEGGDPDLIRPTVGPALTPSVAGWLMPACDYVVNTFKAAKTQVKVTKVAGKDIETVERARGVDYCLRTGPHDTYSTKFRMPRERAVPEHIVDPSYAKIMAVISG